MRSKIVLASLPFVSLASFAAENQDPTDLFSLSFEQLLSLEVDIAARKSESWLTASGTVYVIDHEEIKRYGWRDMKEILAAIPNMDMFYQWSWLPGGQRGFTGNMAATLLLVDGRQVQNLLANEAFIMNNFPAHRIERVEILQGPNSTLYGGNAAQGVINIVTRLPQLKSPVEDGPAEQIAEIGGLVGEVGTWQGNMLLSGGEGLWRYGISGSWFQSDLDYDELKSFVFDDDRFSRNPTLDRVRDHDPNRFRNDEQNITLDARLAYDQYYLGVDLTRTENVSGIERVAVDFITGDDSKRGFSLVYAGRHFQPSEYLTGFAEVSYFNEYKEKLRQKVSGLANANSYDDLFVFSEREDIGPSERYRFRTQFQYQSDPSADWIVGYDYWHTDIGSKIAYVDIGTGIEKRIPSSWPVDKEKSDKHALYAQYAKRWSLEDGATFNLTAGLRYNQQDYTDSAWLPRISLVYGPDDRSAWKLTYGEAFRPPTIFEFDGVEDTELDSQTVQMWELNHSRAWHWQHLKFTNVTALYQMKVENFYRKVFDTQTGRWLTEVEGEQEVHGIENLLRLQNERWQGFWGLRYVSPDESQVGDEMAVLDIPRSKIKLGISYEFNEHWQLSAFIDHWAKTYTQANSLSGTSQIIETIPAWTTVNLNLNSINWQLGGGQRLDIGFYVENLLDKTYYHSNPRGSSPFQFIQAPRNVRVQFSLNF
ncbi:TonB-dependent receptor [Aliiglaciecola sp. CAU 1673]|uniref:TonB-dependent receptor plug domain-containing protein n=1 Tax=Aliiglaciecola sp. CAU 1673 TaxID=3032595 RepID=UPI0023DB14CE|nr:TonB-dependent receptor [Aliiglaciecola sp. CAU 1673]MDF2178880.1 TonB-dependent receptor [Aliiglaciecola sp. CAU 1673]